MNSKADNIAAAARKSISRYCYEDCKSYCCRKGYLNLNDSNVNLVTHGRKEELENNKRLSKKTGDNFSLYLGKDDCPSLKDFKCEIHKNPRRPDACKQFPIFLEGKTLRVSSRCPAVKEGKLYPYIAKLLKLGYKLSETNDFGDFDFESGIKMVEAKH